MCEKGRWKLNTITFLAIYEVSLPRLSDYNCSLSFCSQELLLNIPAIWFLFFPWGHIRTPSIPPKNIFLTCSPHFCLCSLLSPHSFSSLLGTLQSIPPNSSPVALSQQRMLFAESSIKRKGRSQWFPLSWGKRWNWLGVYDSEPEHTRGPLSPWNPK